MWNFTISKEHSCHFYIEPPTPPHPYLAFIVVINAKCCKWFCDVSMESSRSCKHFNNDIKALPSRAGSNWWVAELEPSFLNFLCTGIGNETQWPEKARKWRLDTMWFWLHEQEKPVSFQQVLGGWQQPQVHPIHLGLLPSLWWPRMCGWVATTDEQAWFISIPGNPTNAIWFLNSGHVTCTNKLQSYFSSFFCYITTNPPRASFPTCFSEKWEIEYSPPIIRQ